MAGLLGRKLGMTQVFDEEGNLVPVTVIQAGPCVVVGVRTPEKDGYPAVQLGYEEIPSRKVPKPLRGVFAKAKTAPRRVIREFPLEAGERVEVGTEVKVDLFREGDLVEVTGTSKGKGFAGAMKRWGFGGQRDSHGVSLMHKAVGSIGSSDVGRVWPGKRMPGHMGVERVTVKNLRVVKVDVRRNLLLVKGAVPGPRGGLLEIRKVKPSKA